MVLGVALGGVIFGGAFLSESVRFQKLVVHQPVFSITQPTPAAEEILSVESQKTQQVDFLSSGWWVYSWPETTWTVDQDQLTLQQGALMVDPHLRRLDQASTAVQINEVTLHPIGPVILQNYQGKTDIWTLEQGLELHWEDAPQPYFLGPFQRFSWEGEVPLPTALSTKQWLEYWGVRVIALDIGTVPALEDLPQWGFYSKESIALNERWHEQLRDYAAKTPFNWFATDPTGMIGKIVTFIGAAQSKLAVVDSEKRKELDFDQSLRTLAQAWQSIQNGDWVYAKSLLEDWADEWKKLKALSPQLWQEYDWAVKSLVTHHQTDPKWLRALSEVWDFAPADDLEWLEQNQEKLQQLLAAQSYIAIQGILKEWQKKFTDLSALDSATLRRGREILLILFEEVSLIRTDEQWNFLVQWIRQEVESYPEKSQEQLLARKLVFERLLSFAQRFPNGDLFKLLFWLKDSPQPMGLSIEQQVQLYKLETIDGAIVDPEIAEAIRLQQQQAQTLLQEISDITPTVTSSDDSSASGSISTAKDFQRYLSEQSISTQLNQIKVRNEGENFIFRGNFFWDKATTPLKVSGIFNVAEQAFSKLTIDGSTTLDLPEFQLNNHLQNIRNSQQLTAPPTTAVEEEVKETPFSGLSETLAGKLARQKVLAQFQSQGCELNIASVQPLDDQLTNFMIEELRCGVWKFSAEYSTTTQTVRPSTLSVSANTSMPEEFLLSELASLLPTIEE